MKKKIVLIIIRSVIFILATLMIVVLILTHIPRSWSGECGLSPATDADHYSKEAAEFIGLILCKYDIKYRRVLFNTVKINMKIDLADISLDESYEYRDPITPISKISDEIKYIGSYKPGYENIAHNISCEKTYETESGRLVIENIRVEYGPDNEKLQLQIKGKLYSDDVIYHTFNIKYIMSTE
ncbi:MAG: hypothetical protein VB118_10895 [Oscillospiraceae bacterium]|nr:hypothetical protein [Oscillospiraceae bacterium]